MSSSIFSALRPMAAVLFAVALTSCRSESVTLPSRGVEHSEPRASTADAEKPAAPPPSAEIPAASAAAATAEATVHVTPPDPGAGRRVATEWLLAMQKRDRNAAIALTGVPFTAVGFDLETGPMRNQCGTETGVKAELRFEAPDTVSRAMAIDCLVLDGFLADAVPPYAYEGWPRTAPSGRELVAKGTRGGYSDELNLRAIPQRLQRYSQQLRKLASDHTVVIFFVTDGNGISVEGALATREDNGVTRVYTALLDEKFEE